MLRSGVILLVLGIAVFLAASVQLFRGRTKKAHWCISCVLAMLLVGNGIWNANRYFDLGIGVPKTFSAENWAKTAVPVRFSPSFLRKTGRKPHRNSGISWSATCKTALNLSA